MTQKIILKIGDYEIVIGNLDNNCDGCDIDLVRLIEKKDIEKIYIYKSVIHQDTSWHLEVM